MTANELRLGDVLFRDNRTYTVTHLRREPAGVWADLDAGSGLGVPLFFTWGQRVSVRRRSPAG